MAHNTRIKATAAPARAPSYAPIKDYDRVTLTRAIVAEGHSLPVGATGTVVLTHGQGAAFEVEFTGPAPLHAVVGVEAGCLTRIAGD